MKDWAETDRKNPCHVIAANDTPGDRFKKFAIFTVYPGRTHAAREVAIALYKSMDWAKGVAAYRTSVRELSAQAELSKQAAQDGLKVMVDAGLIELRYVGTRRRGMVSVAAAISEAPAGFVTFDLWPDKKQLSHSVVHRVPLIRTDSATPICPTIQDASVLPIRTICPTIQDGISSPLLHQQSPACSSGPIGVDLAPTTEEHLTSSINIPRPVTTKARAPLPPVASATTKSRVVVATVDGRVAGASDHYGYGTEIAGINGSTNAWVDRFAKADGPLIVDKTPYWVVLKDVARQTSPRRAQAAILDVEAKAVAKTLQGPPLRVLASFARRITEEDAATKLEAASKPKPLIDGLTMFGLRR